MKKYFSFLLFVVLFSYSSNLFAQQSSSNDAWLKYNADKKSEFAAGALEFLIPVVGHAYAGDAGRGVIPAVVSVGGLVVLVVGASDLNAGVATVGYLAYLGGRIWGIVSAVNTAEDYNSNLKSKLNLSFNSMKFPQGKTGYGLTISFNF
ncbi:MAG: hypothetical protein ACYC5R_10815 [Melioribacteraceae bacterium]